MVVVPEKVRNALKKPLGKVYTTYEKVIELSKNFRLVSVGDVCTLALLAIGIKPHLAVFDHKVMRKEIGQQNANILKFAFKKIRKFRNKPGTLSEDLLKAAKNLIDEGGAVFIDGEEDLTALAFIKNADDRTVVIYGQPYVGVVVVEPNKKTRKFVNRIFEQIFTQKSLTKSIKKKSKKGASHKKNLRKKQQKRRK
jgi:uncharacterized protein (UPF0218 family)